MKVGIVPNSDDFRNPGDRRKFYYYCKINNINLERAVFEKHYDILYLSGKTDMTYWPYYKKKNKYSDTKIIFDASDPYLSDPILHNIARSIYFFLFRKSKYYDFSYAISFKRMINCSDIIICASAEQKKLLKKFNKKIFVLRDYFEEDIYDKKTEWEIKNNEINFFWEGQSHSNIKIFLLLKKILTKIKGYKIKLHIVTDRKYCILGGQYVCFSTPNLLQKLFKNTGIEIIFYDWNRENLSSAAKKSDIGLIPIPNKRRLLLKPENKMILMWSLGLPVIATETDSHLRVMNSINSNWLCSSIDEWESKICLLIKEKQARLKYIYSISNFLKNEYSTNALSKTWDKIISI